MAATCKQLKDAIGMIKEVEGTITEGHYAGHIVKVQMWEGKYGRRYVVIRWDDGTKYCKRFSGKRLPSAEPFYQMNAEALQDNAGASLAIMSR